MRGTVPWQGGVLLCLGFLLGSPAFAQETDLKDEVQALKKGQQEILQQLQEIKKLLQGQARPAGPNVQDIVFDLGKRPVKGKDTAKLTLIEITDYQ